MLILIFFDVIVYMDSIADILPKAIRRGALGRKIREQEILEVFELAADRFLPADLRSYVRGMYVKGSILTVASLNGYATTTIKEREAEFLAYIRQLDTRIEIVKIRILA